MKFTEINISEDLAASKGLKPIEMSRLGNVVLIAGKNGSGKTRFLDLIKEQINHIPKKSTVDQYRINIQTYEDGLTSFREQLANFNGQIDTYISSNTEVPQSIIKTKEQTEKNIASYHKGLQDTNNVLNWDVLKVDTYQEKYSVVGYVPKKLELDDSAKKNPQQIATAATKSKDFGVDHLAQTALSQIQSVCTRYSNATNTSLSVNFTKPEIEAAIEEFNRLQEYFSTYLNTTVKINLNGLSEIFGFPIGSAKLSDGQIILVQYCVALFNQQAQLDENVLLLDEPENHLHPEMLLSTLDKIVDANKNGQVWIATHSIHILAHFFEKDIWFMEEGRISFMGRTPERVLTSLLGEEDEIERLHQFISYPSIFATNQYAFESLKYPLSVMTGKTDPQSQQIFDLITNLKVAGKKLKLLDMGAGKGRLLKSIKELSEDGKIDLTDWLDYHAYDKFPNDKNECTSLISDIYGNHEERYFNNETTMLSKLELDSFDVVILVNVLHEISPMEWNDLFDKSSSIYSLLKSDGRLIVVEDQIIPNGEKAYTEGFIVLDVPEFKKLFKLKKYDFDESHGGRLKAHVFNKKDISKFTSISLKDALTSLFLRAKKQVEDVRSKKTTYKNGMVHGFWVQQLANTFLIMNKMGIKLK